VDEFIDLGAKGRLTMEGKSTIIFEAHDGNTPAFAYKAAKLVRQENGSFQAYGERTRMAEGDQRKRPFIPLPGVAPIAVDANDQP